jgi:tetratricopeptide (TPR) repeat protein
MRFSGLGWPFFVAACFFAVPMQASSLSGIDTARALADAAPDTVLRDELRHDVATFLARQGDSAAARSAAAQLPPGRQAMVLLELAAHLPDLRGKEAEQLALDAQTAKALSNDWRKARVAHLLAVAYARMGKFEAAVALAHTVPDTEEKASALQVVVAQLNRAGEIAKAQELAGTIEENRRYGTYRQKAAALADTASTLHTRGNPEEAATLLAQSELLLPKKPGWSDGAAYRDVAVAAFRCGQKEKAVELLTRAEALAQQIAGPWKVTELTRVATAWRACGESDRAVARLTEMAEFLATLTPLERAEESLALAQAWFAFSPDSRDGKAKALALLAAVLAEADRAGNPETWRKPRVRALLATAELSGK